MSHEPTNTISASEALTSQLEFAREYMRKLPAGTGYKNASEAIERAIDLLTAARTSVLLPTPAQGFKWAVVMDEHDGTHPLQQQLDALGVAIADAGYVWTPAMRAAYELKEK